MAEKKGVLYQDASCMYGFIRSDCESKFDYTIVNQEVAYYKKNKKTYQCASVDCIKPDKVSGSKEQIHLYDNLCEIGYDLPDNIVVEEKGE